MRRFDVCAFGLGELGPEPEIYSRRRKSRERIGGGYDERSLNAILVVRERGLEREREDIFTLVR